MNLDQKKTYIVLALLAVFAAAMYWLGEIDAKILMGVVLILAYAATSKDGVNRLEKLLSKLTEAEAEKIVGKKGRDVR